MAVSSNILIAPLDWGLGHATRCIPVIKYLLKQGCTVRIGAGGAAATLLSENFPDLEILPLEGYNIQYSKYRKAFTTKIIFQVPKIIRAIRRERNWVARMQQQYEFDLIISDNRYGLRHKDIFSVIMTHQLQIKSGQGRWTDTILKWLHYPLLQRFNACWVVDNPGKGNIGGDLSHPDNIPLNASYIGLLSQLTAAANCERNGNNILVLLSGPEPMRGILEQKILNQAVLLSNYRFTLVAGNPSGSVPRELPAHIRYYTHLHAATLQGEMDNAALVVCRSGYSTLMDLAALRQKALLVPTPGQAEQEYLGQHLMKSKLFLSKKQELLELPVDIEAALKYPGFSGFGYDGQHSLMKRAIETALKEADKKKSGLIKSTL